jgi:hypothetical protein
MAKEDPKEEEEQEELAKIVTEEFINLSDPEEPTKHEKKSDQAIHQDKGKPAAKETQEDTECGPRDPGWGKMSRMEHPPSEERLEEFNKYGMDRQFLSYVKAEQVLAWFTTMRKKLDGYEEVLQKAMAAAPVERPEDLVESIVKQ